MGWRCEEHAPDLHVVDDECPKHLEYLLFGLVDLHLDIQDWLICLISAMKVCLSRFHL